MIASHSPRPTVAEITNYLQQFFPVCSGDASWLYHQPRRPSYSAAQCLVSSIVLSVTPTPGFYARLHHGPNGREAGARLGFLHRPFDLERRRVPRLSTIVACHKAFDEVLTVGYNVALARRLALDVDAAIVIQGYKGDPDRKIGLVARFAQTDRMTAGEIRKLVTAQFGNEIEGTFGFDDDDSDADGGRVDGVAIMNAFHPEEVVRAIDAVRSLGAAVSEDSASRLVYLTGAVREPGLAFARERGIRVICVGHRTCEDWGVRYLAEQLRKQFPGLLVDEVYEEEPPRLPKPLPNTARRQNGRAPGMLDSKGNGTHI